MMMLGAFPSLANTANLETVSEKNLTWPSGSKNSPKIIFKSFPVLPRPQNGR